MKYVLGLAQCCHPDDGDVVAMVDRIAASSRERGVDVLVFPESLMTRYEKELQAFLAEAEPVDGAFASALNALAAKHGLWMVYTMNERNDADSAKPFNTAVMVDDAGVVRGYYRKAHLFDTDFTHESDRMGRGDELFDCIDTPFGRIGLGICYDLRFPEVARHCALRGADLMIYPAAWVRGPHKVHQWRTLLAARAIENEMFVAGLSRPDSGSVGNSCVFDPLGEVVAEAGEGEELLLAEIDTERIASARKNMPVLEHRRPELYD